MRKNQTNKIQGVSKKYLSDYRQNASKLQQAIISNKQQARTIPSASLLTILYQ
jgi:hypothetical protein